VWVPPSFRPDSGTQAGTVLQLRLDAFEAAHPGVTVRVRVKAADGAGGIRDSLAMTSAAAPASLPDVVVLSQAELRAAALKGLITRLDSQAGTVRLYPFADAIVRLEDGPYGQPFAADLYVLAASAQDERPGDLWADLTGQGGRCFFPLADPLATGLFLEYYAAEGPPDSRSRGDRLVEEPLAVMLSWLRDLYETGVLPAANLELDSPAAARARLFLPTDRALTTFSALAGSGAWKAGGPPTPDGRTFTLATAWSWAIATQDPSRGALSAALVDWLSEPEFLSQWTRTLGLLPVAPESLRQWPETPDRERMNDLLENASAFPTEETAATVGPILRQAAADVLAGAESPEEAAHTAILALPR
jgi:multiple sugar transport system substrate-binding protein